MHTCAPLFCLSENLIGKLPKNSRVSLLTSIDNKQSYRYTPFKTNLDTVRLNLSQFE